jgi:hypothetical protein
VEEKEMMTRVVVSLFNGHNQAAKNALIGRPRPRSHAAVTTIHLSNPET